MWQTTTSIPKADCAQPSPPSSSGWGRVRRSTSLEHSLDGIRSSGCIRSKYQHLRASRATAAQRRVLLHVSCRTAKRIDLKTELHQHPNQAYSGPSKHKDAFSAIIHLAPGTHHLKFLVDNEMQLSPELPTAVDFTNILVNYLEVSPDDIPQAQQPQPTAPVDIPGQQRSEEKPEMRAPPGVYPPQILPPSPEIQQISQNNPPASGTPAAATSNPTPVAPAPPKQYHCVIPQYLADLDAEEESSRFARANAVLNTMPPPPSLPVMLSKSILNGSMPMKDDSSVLNMPNHTVLNHLATSSIKHNVLATSATTRYKRKACSLHLLQLYQV